MNRSELLAALLAQRPLVCDGAFGTQLQALGLQPGSSGEAWNADRPEQVSRVHRDYLEAGADLLITNTFGGTRLALGLHGIDVSRTVEINRAGVRLAREVAGDRAFVLGGMGPFGGLMEPLGDVAPATVSSAFEEQANALAEGGADALIVETLSDPAEAALAVEAARKTGLRVFATAAYQHTPDGFRTMMGTSIAEMVGAMIDAGADVVGANCGTRLSLDDYLAMVPELSAAAGGKPVMVEPNAGSPEIAPDGSIHYQTDRQAFAQTAPKLVAAGARIIGGCCGTSPVHVSAIASALRA